MASNYVSRRMTSSSSSASWVRNRNAVRHAPKVSLGPISHTITCLLFVVLLGFIYLGQSSKVTDYDVSLAEVNAEISSLEAQRDALVVENAKLTASAATEEKNEVASTMVDAQSADFVKEF